MAMVMVDDGRLCCPLPVSVCSAPPLRSFARICALASVT